MRNPFRMQIIKGFSYLLEEPSAHTFSHLAVCALLLHILVQARAGYIVGDDAYLLRGFYQVVHPDDVRVIDSFQSHDFSLDGFSLHGVVQLCFLVNFNSKFPLSWGVHAQVYYSVSTLANWLTNLIVFEDTLAHRLTGVLGRLHVRTLCFECHRFGRLAVMIKAERSYCCCVIRYAACLLLVHVIIGRPVEPSRLLIFVIKLDYRLLI